MTKHRSPDDLLKALLDYENDDPNEPAIEEMTRGERDARVRALGFDPEQLRAAGEKHASEAIARLGGPPLTHGVAHAAPAVAAASGTPMLWLAIGVVVVVAAIAALLLSGGKPDIIPSGPDPLPSAIPRDASAPPAPPPRAEDLVATAREQCGDRAWQKCLASLNAARALSPGGADGAEAKALRAAAMSGLAQDNPAPKAEGGKGDKGGH
jgi:hypothetical protein